MLNVTFLGVNGSLQEPWSGNTSLLLKGQEGSAAVDLSGNVAAVAEADVDGVILTHEHIDHVYALPSLLHQLWIMGRRRELTIYLPDGMEGLVSGFIDLFGLRQKKNIYDIRLSTETAFRIGSLQITTFVTDHTAMSRGLAAEVGTDKLVYTCDTRPIREVLPVMEGARVLIHEASGLFEEEEILIKKGHSSGRDAGQLAADLGAEKLYLCHLPKGERKKAEILKEARAVFPESDIPELFKALSV